MIYPCRCPFSATSLPRSSAVLSPSSSIKSSHILCWSAVRSLSHHHTRSLPTCWTLRQPLLLGRACAGSEHGCPDARLGGDAAAETSRPWGTSTTHNLPVRSRYLPTPGNSDTWLHHPASATNPGPRQLLWKKDSAHCRPAKESRQFSPQSLQLEKPGYEAITMEHNGTAFYLGFTATKLESIRCLSTKWCFKKFYILPHIDEHEFLSATVRPPVWQINAPISNWGDRDSCCKIRRWEEDTRDCPA